MSGRDELEVFLRERGISWTEELKTTLVDEYGVNHITDLTLLTEEELKQAGLNRIQSRTILRDSKQFLQSMEPQASHSISSSHMPSFTVSTSLQQHYYTAPLVSTQHKQFKINYLLCIELFTCDQQEHSLVVNPEQDTMEFLIRHICNTNHLQDILTLELISKTGCPLNVNDYTMKFTLSQWKIQNNDSFYAFPRRRDQPAWTFPELLNDDTIEPTEGENTLKIYCEVYGKFSINVNLNINLKVDTILKKVSKIIGVPSQFISLHKSCKNFATMRDQELTDVKNGEELVIRLGEVCSLQNKFGKPSYIPTTEQTERGLAKFYSILKHLALSRKDCKSIVAVVFKLTNCIPLAAALHNFLIYRSFSHLSYLTVLFEGLYHFTRATLLYFCEVDLEKTFEFFDYVAGFILSQAEKISTTEQLSFKTVRLRCPITGMNIIDPVTIKGQTSYERSAAIEKIENFEALPECTDVIKKEDLSPYDQLQQYLISVAFSKVVDILVCEAVSETKMRIQPLAMPCTWKELKSSLNDINIVDPTDLSSSALTYTAGGYLSVFIEVTKTVEMGRILYDPLTGENVTYTENDLKKFVCKEKDISHDIVVFLRPKVRALLTDSDLEPDVKVKVSKKSSITREPKEAIMVLLDTSSSMKEGIFNEGSCGATADATYKRITAATDFFIAFANRTQAYELHHVVGAIYFNKDSKEEIPLTETLSQFKSKIKEAPDKISRGTALYDALKKGADSLIKFTSQYPLCCKRILCLTDGEDYRSKTKPIEISRYLNTNDVIVDSILLTGPSGNKNLKGISLATGGMCFLPTIRAEGMRIFEMELLLSVRQRRRMPKAALRTDADFTKLTEQPYHSSDPYSFKSSFFMELDETTTCSAKRMVLLASFVSGGTTSSSGQVPHVKSVMRELMAYDRNPHEDVAVFPDESNICHWKILMRGPKATPYEGGVYLLFAKFPNEYPYKPPEIRFVTPIYHCNINSVGRICHPILGRNYVPSLTIKEIFEQVFGLMMAPEPDDPLDSVLAEEFHTNKEEYMRKAQELNREKAVQITWEEYKTALSEDKSDVTTELKCPLTGKLYMDPVSTPYGHTYERDALLQYMATNNNADPIAKQPLSVEDLRPCREIRALADTFRRTNLL